MEAYHCADLNVILWSYTLPQLMRIVRIRNERHQRQALQPDAGAADASPGQGLQEAQVWERAKAPADAKAVLSAFGVSGVVL